jgi:hypothetical protein
LPNSLSSAPPTSSGSGGKVLGMCVPVPDLDEPPPARRVGPVCGKCHQPYTAADRDYAGAASNPPYNALFGGASGAGQRQLWGIVI